jgi:hypothetical protein
MTSKYHEERQREAKEALKRKLRSDPVPSAHLSEYLPADYFNNYDLVSYSPAEIYRTPYSGNLTIKAPVPPELRENTSMNTVLTEREQIDAEVREAIAAPRRAREIALRIAAVKAIGIDDTHEAGTVMRFKRKYGSNVYTYAVIKAENGMWYMTGANSSHNPYSWESLTEWMTTGENLITDLQIADTWTQVSWSADPTTVADAS